MPATFQRLLDHIIGPDMEPRAFAYLDDIMVTGKTFEEHLANLKEVLHRLLAANLRVNIDKCQFVRESLKYLGHVVDQEGLRTDPDKVRAIIELPTSANVRELRRFLGVASWYRRFVPSHATVVAPLNGLLRKKSRWQWEGEHEAAFQTIKQEVATAPVLKCPDFTRMFVLRTDASAVGLGAVLTQDLDGREQVAYASRTLQNAEHNYSATEKESLAVMWEIQKMRPYLEAYRFKVITDHFSLKWLQTPEIPSGRLARWSVALQQFDFEVEY